MGVCLMLYHANREAITLFTVVCANRPVVLYSVNSFYICCYKEFRNERIIVANRKADKLPVMSGHNLPSIASQFAVRKPGFAMHCCVAKYV